MEFLSEKNKKNSGFINFNYEYLEKGLKSAHLQPYTLVSLGFFKYIEFKLMNQPENIPEFISSNDI